MRTRRFVKACFALVYILAIVLVLHYLAMAVKSGRWNQLSDAHWRNMRGEHPGRGLEFFGLSVAVSGLSWLPPGSVPKQHVLAWLGAPDKVLPDGSAFLYYYDDPRTPGQDSFVVDFTSSNRVSLIGFTPQTPQRDPLPGARPVRLRRQLASTLPVSDLSSPLVYLGWALLVGAVVPGAHCARRRSYFRALLNPPPPIPTKASPPPIPENAREPE